MVSKRTACVVLLSTAGLSLMSLPFFLTESPFPSLGAAQKALHFLSAQKQEDAPVKAPVREYRWMPAGLGDAFLHYWQMRASTALTGTRFRATEKSTSEILTLYPHEGVTDLSPSQIEALETFRDKIDLAEYYPWKSPSAAFHFFRSNVIAETEKVKEQLLPVLGEDNLKLARDEHHAIVHLHCDADSLATPEMGFVPHFFILDNMPSHVKSITVMGTPNLKNTTDPCGYAAHALAERIERRFNLTVTLRFDGSLTTGWLLLSMAKTVFCWPSTFCFSAAFANPTTRIFQAVVGQYSCLAESDSSFRNFDNSLVPAITYVQTHFLKGPELLHRNISLEAIGQYLDSKDCDAAAAMKYGCLKGAPSTLEAQAPAGQTIFVGIKSAPQRKYKARRDAWRKSACAEEYTKAGIRYKFFIGRPLSAGHDLTHHDQGSKDTQEEQDDASALYEEATKYDDIELIPMRDAYEDLSNKLVSLLTYAYRWTRASYVVEHDDEYCLKVGEALNVIRVHESRKPAQEFYGGCYIFGGKEYKQSAGPHGETARFVSGNLMMISRGLLRYILTLDYPHTVLNGMYGGNPDDANLGKWVKYAIDTHHVQVNYVSRNELLWSPFKDG